VELESGIVVRTEDGVAALLLHKADLAVIAVVAGWPSPTDLPNGQDVHQIIDWTD
jgi:hypothetical protein